jgi:hypothetical protein
VEGHLQAETYTKYKQMFNLLGKTIIRVDFCRIAKKLKFEIMYQHHAHPSFGVLARLEASGNTVRHNTTVRI